MPFGCLYSAPANCCLLHQFLLLFTLLTNRSISFLATLRGVWDPSSPSRDWTRTQCTGSSSPSHWVTREVPLLPSVNLIGMPGFYVKSPNLYLCLSHFLKSPCEENKTHPAGGRRPRMQRNVTLGVLLWKSRPQPWPVPALGQDKCERGGREAGGQSGSCRWVLRLSRVIHWPVKSHDSGRMINTRNLI